MASSPAAPRNVALERPPDTELGPRPRRSSVGGLNEGEGGWAWERHHHHRPRLAGSSLRGEATTSRGCSPTSVSDASECRLLASPSTSPSRSRPSTTPLRDATNDAAALAERPRDDARCHQSVASFHHSGHGLVRHITRTKNDPGEGDGGRVGGSSAREDGVCDGELYRREQDPSDRRVSSSFTAGAPPRPWRADETETAATEEEGPGRGHYTSEGPRKTKKEKTETKMKTGGFRRPRRTEAEKLAPFSWDARAALHPAGEKLRAPSAAEEGGGRVKRPVERFVHADFEGQLSRRRQRGGGGGGGGAEVSAGCRVDVDPTGVRGWRDDGEVEDEDDDDDVVAESVDEDEEDLPGSGGRGPRERLGDSSEGIMQRILSRSRRRSQGPLARSRVPGGEEGGGGGDEKENVEAASNAARADRAKGEEGQLRRVLDLLSRPRSWHPRREGGRSDRRTDSGDSRRACESESESESSGGDDDEIATARHGRPCGEWRATGKRRARHSPSHPSSSDAANNTPPRQRLPTSDERGTPSPAVCARVYAAAPVPPASGPEKGEDSRRIGHVSRGDWRAGPRAGGAKRRRRALQGGRACMFIDAGGPSDGSDDGTSIWSVDADDTRAIVDDEEDLSSHSDASLRRTRGPRGLSSLASAPARSGAFDPLEADAEEAAAEEAAAYFERRAAAGRLAGVGQVAAHRDDAFEVDDADGWVSEHSDGSQERTAGARGFKMTELLGDGYGRGKRRAGGGGGGGGGADIAARIARRKQGGRSAWRDSEDSEDSLSRTDEEEEDGVPALPSVPSLSGDAPRHRSVVKLGVRTGEARTAAGATATRAAERGAGGPWAAADREDASPPDEDGDARAGAVVEEETEHVAASDVEMEMFGWTEAADMSDEEAAGMFFKPGRRRRRRREPHARVRSTQRRVDEMLRGGPTGAAPLTDDDPPTVSTTPSTTPPVALAPPPAPWSFPPSLDPTGYSFDGAEADQEVVVGHPVDGSGQAAEVVSGSGCARGWREEGERALRAAVRLFRATCSAGRPGFEARGRGRHDARQAPMSAGHRATWRRAAVLLERVAPGAFWIALREVIVEERRADADAETDLTAPETEETEEAAEARRTEAGWELLFVAGATWRAEGASSTHAVDSADDAWATSAWAAAAEVLAASPLPPPRWTTSDDPRRESCPEGTARPSRFESRRNRKEGAFDSRAYAAAVAARVAALVEAWPRCTSPRAPAWETWRRTTGIGTPMPNPGSSSAGPLDSSGNRTRDATTGDAKAKAKGTAAAGIWPLAPRGTSSTVADTSGGRPEPGRMAALRMPPVTCDCCDLPSPPAWARGGDGWGGNTPRGAATSWSTCGALVEPSGGNGASACSAALRAVTAHLGKAKARRDLRRDLGVCLSAASLAQTRVGRTVSSKTSDPEMTSEVSETFGWFRAGGIASPPLPLTRRAVDLRHRAALHAQLVSVCLAAGLADQAATCIRQLRGALSGAHNLPRAHVDPAPRALACRALATAAAAWLDAVTSEEYTRKRQTPRETPSESLATNDLNDEASEDAGWRGLETLCKEGEAALASLASEAAVVSSEAAAVTVGSSTARAVAAVAVEAAAAAAVMWAALVASGACPPGAAALQQCFVPPVLRAPTLAAAWPARVFAQRVLAALLAPGSPLYYRSLRRLKSAQTTPWDPPAVEEEDLTPALALWALAAGADAATGGVTPLAAVLFAHPSLPVLNEGAAAGAGAAAVARLQAGTTGVEGVLRGVEHPGAPSTVFGAGGWNTLEGRPGDALSAMEAAFRVSAGALVGAQLASKGAAGAAAIDVVVAELPHLASATRRDLARGCHPESHPGGEEKEKEKAFFARRTRETNRDRGVVEKYLGAHAAAAAGAVRWLVEVSARSSACAGVGPAASFDGSLGEMVRGYRPSASDEVGAPLASLAPLLPWTADSWGAGGTDRDRDRDRDVARGDRGGTTVRSMGRSVAALLEAEHPGGCHDLMRDVVTAVARRWTVGDTSAARDLAAATVGVVEGVLGRGGIGDEADAAREEAALDALAAALLEAERSAAEAKEAVAHVAKVLLPGVLLHELREAPQKRCARIWVNAITLCRHLIRRDRRERRVLRGVLREREPASLASGVLHESALLSSSLAAPGVLLLEAVAGEGDFNHQAVAALAELFALLTEQLDAAAGVLHVGMGPVPAATLERKGREAVSTTLPPPIAPRDGGRWEAPGGYFPFPGDPHAVTPAAAASGGGSGGGGWFPFPGSSGRIPAEAEANGRREAEEREKERERERETDDEERRLAAAALSTPLTATLLRASVAGAVLALAAAALAAPLGSNPGGGAFVVLGRAGAGDERSREIARHRAVLTAARECLRRELNAEARETIRFALDGGALSGAASLPPGAIGRSGGGGVNGGVPGSNPSGGGATDWWWGAGAVPRGAHRVSEEWSQPRARLRLVSTAAAAFLRAVTMPMQTVPGWNPGGGGAGGFAATHVRAHVGALQSAAALLSAAEAAGCGPGAEVLSDLLRGMGAGVTRLPSAHGGLGGRDHHRGGRAGGDVSSGVLRRGRGGGVAGVGGGGNHVDRRRGGGRGRRV